MSNASEILLSPGRLYNLSVGKLFTMVIMLVASILVTQTGCHVDAFSFQSLLQISARRRSSTVGAGVTRPSSVRPSSSFSWQRHVSLADDETEQTESSLKGMNGATAENKKSVDDWLSHMSAHSQIDNVQGTVPALLEEDNPGDDANWVDESKHVELVGLIAWMASVSAFILINNFIGPFPEFFKVIHERVFFLGHMMGGMLFGGGIILTTAIEWMVCQTKNASVLIFWFDKVPLLDMALVLPGLTLSMISGTGLTIVRYGGLDHAPQHITSSFWALVAFGVWWGMTDLTTQGSALNAVMEASSKSVSEELNEVPKEVTGRVVSNLGSCFLVLVMYGFMVLKPGTIHYW